MATRDQTTAIETANVLIDELLETGHGMTLADLLDCLASAGLVLVREPQEAAQAYSDYILRSLETAA
jgi:hypothetical protein